MSRNDIVKVDGSINYDYLGESIDGLSSQMADIAINVKYPPLGFAPAKGDGINDDYNSLQAIFNYAYDTKTKIYFPKGNYITSKPIIIYGNSQDNSGYCTIIEGAGRDVTNIIKNTNDTLTSEQSIAYSGIDAIFIIGNELTRNNIGITNIWSTESIAKYIQINNLSLEGSAPNQVNYGIYSLGIYLSKFFNIALYNMNIAVKTIRYNCFNTFERLEISLCFTGFEFLTDSGAATTLRFEDVHLNGLNGIGYNILGSATFVNCSIDGGHLIIFNIVNGKATLIRCHSESPASNGIINATTQILNSALPKPHCSILAISCYFEMPMESTNPTFKASSNSMIHLMDCFSGAAIRNNYYLDHISNGQLYSADKTSRVIFDNFQAGTIGTYVIDIPYSISENEKYIIIDKHHLDITYNKYISYVGSSINSTNYNTFSITTDDITNEIILDTELSGNGSGHGMTWGIIFKDPIKLDEYSRVYMKAALDFGGSGSGGSNSYNCELVVCDSLFNDGSVSKDTNAPYVRKDYYNYDDLEHEFYIDISDLYGLYYISIRLYNVVNVKITEISLLK